MKSIFTFLLFCVSMTSVAQQYSFGEKEFSEQEEDASAFISFDKTNFPSLDSAVDLSSKLPPSANQGTKGSCWAWATAYAIRSAMDGYPSYFKNGKVDNTKVYSPEFAYQVYKGKVDDCNWGATSSEMLEKILKDGVVKLSDFPYDERACNTQPTETIKKLAIRNAKPGYTVEKIHDLYSIQKVLSVDRQPLIISIKLDDYFSTKGNINLRNPYWKTFGTRKNSHAMVIVGYSDKRRSIKVLNSWGPEFGDKGFVWISYSIVNAAMNYACFPVKTLAKLPVTKKTEQKAEATSLEIGVDLPATNQRVGLSRDTLISWFKEGYYRPFDNLKIVLAKLDTKRKYAVIEIRNNNYDLISNFYIDIKASKELPVKGKRYKFTFDYINIAGKNPFNKAVYFTVNKIAVD